MYDYIIVTHIPAFYKVNLYNELAKKLKILVVFIASNTSEKRSDDFITLESINFKYNLLFDGNFQDREVNKNIKKLKSILNQNQYKKIIISGWDLKEFWYLVFTNSKNKLCLALESTINESRCDGVRGIIKKIFLSRVSTVFASGQLHKELLAVLSYKGKIRITKGVGIINKPKINTKKINKKYQKRFLFIGRLSKEKNIEMLIDVFNDLEEHILTIIGTGPLEQKLKSKVKSNIVFEGEVENKKLKKYFNLHDFFILPSIVEPWGLVIEEALYFKLPVIVSKNCGASELIKDDINGYIFESHDTKKLKNIIQSIDESSYQRLLDIINNSCLDDKDISQLESYAL